MPTPISNDEATKATRRRTMDAARARTIGAYEARRLGIAPRSKEDVLAEYGASLNQWTRARYVLAHGTPELIKLAETGEISLNTLFRVAHIQDPDEQNDYVSRVRLGEDPIKASPAMVDKGRRDLPPLHREAIAETAGQMGALRHLLTSTSGVDPEITSAEAARWASDLGRYRQHLTHLINRLKERQA